MIGISKLYCGAVEPADVLRYGRHSSRLPSHLLQFSTDKKPVVVWNITRRCNLRCVHCYAHATEQAEANELTTAQGKALIDDLAAFGAPVLLFSGGEPLMRPDLPELAAYAVSKGMRAVISTNGTLITRGDGAHAQGHRPVLRRRQPGRDARRSTTASGRCRGPSTRRWRASATARRRGSRSACASRSTATTSPRSRHLRPARGQGHPARVLLPPGLLRPRLEAGDARTSTTPRPARTVDLIMDRTRAPARPGKPKEVLTVDNHADGPYVYLRLLREDPARAARGPGALADERGQQLRPRDRLHQLGRRGPPRPVLAAPHLRQRARSARSPRSGRTPRTRSWRSSRTRSRT